MKRDNNSSDKGGTVYFLQLYLKLIIQIKKVGGKAPETK